MFLRHKSGCYAEIEHFQCPNLGAFVGNSFSTKKNLDRAGVFRDSRYTRRSLFWTGPILIIYLLTKISILAREYCSSLFPVSNFSLTMLISSAALVNKGMVLSGNRLSNSNFWSKYSETNNMDKLYYSYISSLPLSLSLSLSLFIFNVISHAGLTFQILRRDLLCM